MRYPNLFRPIVLRGTALKNRVVFASHGLGQTMPALIEYHRARAEGGVGLIVTQSMTVHSSYQVGRTLSVADDSCIPDLQRLTKVCRQHQCEVFGQLFHPGAAVQGLRDGARMPAWAPSAVPTDRYHVMPAAMPAAMIADVIAAYGDGAGRFVEAGMKGVELLASHGYLPAQFLDPRTNRREDDFGGNVANRARFTFETLQTIRAKVGPDIAIGIRLSVDSPEDEGETAGLSLQIARLVSDGGLVDYISLAGGSASNLRGAAHIAPPMIVPHAHLQKAAAKLKQAVAVPVILASRINDPIIAEQLLKDEAADMIGLVRPLICDPQFAAKAEAGRLDDIRACIGCNQACIGHRYAGAIVSCIQRPESGRELRFPHVRQPAALRRHVIVAGAGPGGLKAAAVAGERGHRVTICEETRQIGGQALLAQQLPGRAEFGGIVTNLRREVENAGVGIEVGVRVDADYVRRSGADALIVATGALPYTPPLDGLDGTNVVQGWDVIRGRAALGSRVVVADWRCDWVGLGIAELIARQGSNVRLYCQGIMAGETLPSQVRDSWVGILHSLDVEVHTYARLFGFDGDTAYFEHMANGAAILCPEVDTLVLSQGTRAASTLAEDLAGWPGIVKVIGDALNPRTAEEAVLEGLEAVMTLS